MKINNFIVLSFLLFAFTATSIFPRAVHAEAVVDVFGDEVRTGGRYFIAAASNDFAVSATSRIICNSDVVFSPMSDGLPVIFSPVVESNDSVINEDSHLTVDFFAASCRMAGVSTMWKIEFRPTARGFVVTTGGVAGLNRFKITKYEGGNNLYQLSYCPISEPICECSCVPLGKVVNRLAPSTVPFPVVFVPSDRASKIEYKMI
ncbi:PREDICTED: wound-responsive protein GWIN3-like [Populus euphratica]|uniref:Wound-responsive protein GWIN3-like n=1 Tax=Populus euphratica TaxID=75702 RepID=A0AAJ6TP62_POPEU|nr:PREDICTED: wound-responsive protein GWIN3-like [Populus euphratica]